VVFSLATPQGFNVLPGMTANIRIDLSKITQFEQQHFWLPISAVFSAEDSALANKSHFIWKLNSDTMRVSRAQITVAELTNDGFNVVSGIKAGDLVVSAGVHFLSEGVQVRPWNREKGL
jgi:multidrug efflux pump subunit AcrA (membrane-fusion protein)